MNSFSLDIKSLLKPSTTHTTLYDLINEVSNIKLDKSGSIISSTEQLISIKQSSSELSVLINSLIKHVALILGYSLDGKTETKHAICHFYIIHGMNSVADDLKVFGKVCDHAIKTNYWPTDFEEFPRCSLLSFLAQVPSVNIPNATKDALSFFVDTAASFTDPQIVNLRIFSESFVYAHATGEIEEDISGALTFSNQWIGLIDAINLRRDDAVFDLNQQKAA